MRRLEWVPAYTLVLACLTLAPKICFAQGAIEPPATRAGSATVAKPRMPSPQPVPSEPAASASAEPVPPPSEPVPPASTEVAPEAVSPEKPELSAAREQLAIAQVRRELQKLKETERELFYYNWMGRAMFVIVHLILALGLWMAWWEFKNARTRRAQAIAEPEQELKLSLEGIALKSSLHGTVLLGLAFGFYLVYVKFVYPMVTVP